MNRYDDIVEGRIEPERKLELPFSADDGAGACSGQTADCIMIRIVREESIWVVMISETASAIRASVFSFDSVSDGKERSYRGFCVYRSLRGRQTDSAKAGTRA